MKFFRIIPFILSLILGLAFIYLTAPASEIIVVYPTPSNVDKTEYKDKNGICYRYQYNKIDCPNKGVVDIPLQD